METYDGTHFDAGDALEKVRGSQFPNVLKGGVVTMSLLQEGNQTLSSLERIIMHCDNSTHPFETFLMLHQSLHVAIHSLHHFTVRNSSLDLYEKTKIQIKFYLLEFIFQLNVATDPTSSSLSNFPISSS